VLNLYRPTFYYGLSRVDFDASGHVVGYDDIAENLQVRLLPTIRSTARYFSIASTEDEVLSVQGTPTGVLNLYRPTFYYGLSRVDFDPSGRVIDYSNIAGNLQVR
jgi:hypothetical protein